MGSNDSAKDTDLALNREDNTRDFLSSSGGTDRDHESRSDRHFGERLDRPSSSPRAFTGCDLGPVLDFETVIRWTRAILKRYEYGRIEADESRCRRDEWRSRRERRTRRHRFWKAGQESKLSPELLLSVYSIPRITPARTAESFC